MDEGKVRAEAVSDRRRPLGTARIRADDDRIPVVGDVHLDVPLEERPPVQVVDGHVEETLDCTDLSQYRPLFFPSDARVTEMGEKKRD